MIMQKKFWKKALAFLMVIAVMLSTTLIYSPNALAKVLKNGNSITITSPATSTLYMKKGETFTLKTKILPSDTSKIELKYNSNNVKVVKISKSGKLTALKNGSATITITAEDISIKKASVKVVVSKSFTKVKKVTLNVNKATLFLGGNDSEKTVTLSATVSPSKATVKTVKYVSSNKNIATVSSKGVVTAVAKGSVTITAYAADGRGAKATCKITVAKKPKVTQIPTPQVTLAPTAEPTAEPTATPAVTPTTAPTAAPALPPVSTGGGTGTSPIKVTPTISPTTVPTVTPTTAPVVAGNKVAFTTSNNYRSYLTINIPLPDGVTAKDITKISFTVDTAKPLSLRLYGGDGTVTNSNASELTHEATKNEETVVSVEEVTTEGVTVNKTVHNLVETVVETTRPELASGNGQKVEYTVDGYGKSVLNNISGKALSLGIYANNVAPAFSVYELQIVTATNTYSITLNSAIVGASTGGTATIISTN